MRSHKVKIGVILALVATLSATACSQNATTGGSTSAAASTVGIANAAASSSGSNASAPAGTSGTAEAAKAVAQYLSAPTEIPLKTPLAKRPPSGKTIIITEDAAGVAKKTNDGVELGAKMLGWTVKRLPIGSGPEDAAKALDAALDQKPDGIITSGHAASTLRAQVARAKQMGIPIVFSETTDPAGSDGTVHIIGIDDKTQLGLWGTMTANYAVSLGAKHVLVVNLSAFKILNSYSETAVARVEKLGAKATLIDAQLSDFVGGKIPAQVVSEIQRDPSIDWVLLCLGDMATGLSAALKDAGFTDKVKVGGESASSANVAALKAGTESGWTGFAGQIDGMYRVDAMARIFNGEPLTNEYENLPTQMLTPANIGTAPLEKDGYYAAVPAFQEYFHKLWKL